MDPFTETITKNYGVFIYFFMDGTFHPVIREEYSHTGVRPTGSKEGRENHRYCR